MKIEIESLTARIDLLTKKLKIIGLSPLSFGLFILLALAPSFIQDEYTMYLLVICLMFGTLAMGFDLSAGFIGVANWGYAALMGLGAYTSAILMMRLGISPWIGIFVGAMMAAFIGMLIGILTLRMGGMFAAILAWFVGLVLMALSAALISLTRGAMGMNVNLFFKSSWAQPYAYVMLAICFVTFIVLKMITQSKLGLAFNALGQDVEAARTSGVNLMKYKVINFTISCFIAGLCGGFYAHFIGILSPSLLATKQTIQVLVIAFVGGRGSIWGPLVAAFLIIPTFEYLSFLMEYKFVIYGLLLILVMIFYPTGLAGLLNNVSSFAKRKMSSRSLN